MKIKMIMKKREVNSIREKDDLKKGGMGGCEGEVINITNPS